MLRKHHGNFYRSFSQFVFSRETEAHRDKPTSLRLTSSIHLRNIDNCLVWMRHRPRHCVSISEQKDLDLPWEMYRFVEESQLGAGEMSKVL